MKRIIIVAGGNLDGNVHDMYYSMPIRLLVSEELEELKESEGIEMEMLIVDTVLTLMSLLKEKREEWLGDEVYVLLLTAGLIRHISDLFRVNERIYIILYTADPSLMSGIYQPENLKVCVKSSDLNELFGMLGFR